MNLRWRVVPGLMPRVTVVTAAYNAAPYIAEAVESVLAQTYTDLEYIVVDDGSTDNTAAIVARCGPRVSLIRQENAGEGPARNRGFALAGGDYVAVIDADDVWAPDKLERQVLAMEGHPDAGLCYTNASSVRADGSVLEAVLVPRHSRLTCLMAMTTCNPIVNSSVMYRRRFLEKHPYRSLPIAADLHVNLKVLWRSGERSVFVDEPLVRYRVVETSVLRQVDAYERGRLTLRAVEMFIDDMECDKPLPSDLRRKGLAYSHFMWAWYCINGRRRYGFATRELLRALGRDWGLAPQVTRQFVKMGLSAASLR